MAQERRLQRGYREKRPPGRAYMVSLYRRLDLLAAIAADPVKRANALAWRIARGREGYIMPPDRLFRPPGCVRRLWRTETEMTFNALGYGIGTASRTRAPQLPRRERPGPRIRGSDAPKAWPWPDWLPGAQDRCR